MYTAQAIQLLYYYITILLYDYTTIRLYYYTVCDATKEKQQRVAPRLPRNVDVCGQAPGAPMGV